MQIDNMYITASPQDILLLLRSECVKRGLPYFNTIRQSGFNTMATCPFHKGGVERKPSFGVSDDGACHCFTCGYSGRIDDMISRVLSNGADSGQIGRRWLANNFLSMSIASRTPLKLAGNLKRSRSGPIRCSEPFTEEELSTYRYTHPYMYQRGLDDAIIEMFDIGYDSSTNCLTFPVYHEDGSPAFIARRSTVTKFFSYPEFVDKPVYAAHLLTAEHKEVYIVESIFNALTCWRYGVPAVSLLGLGNALQYKILQELPVRKYVLALDPDKAGAEATVKLKDALNRRKLLSYLQYEDSRDINDLGKSFLDLSIAL